ncbi:MAG: hypothetical protein R3F65_03485 [bacterium]
MDARKVDAAYILAMSETRAASIVKEIPPGTWPCAGHIEQQGVN